jgi:hypothetical protein
VRQEAEGGTRVTLHEEIANILRGRSSAWMSTQEIADLVNARGRYRKKDGSTVTDFQVHGRTKNYPDLFDRDGSRVRLKQVQARLSFNHLLAMTGIDPAEVRLLRHTPEDCRREVFNAAMEGDASFERYQETQGNPKVIGQLREARYLAGFIVAPLTKATLFVGLWERLGERPAAWSDSDMPGSHTVGARCIAFETRHIQILSEYRGRLVIDWGVGERAWVQRADRQNKQILELRKEVADPPFPGFLELRAALDEVADFPETWTTALRNARGVYLLVHRERGDQYVGSASGTDGFLGRWLSYADGHGGNVAQRELGSPAAAYDVSVLEVVGSVATIDEIHARESAWKNKLGTRAKSGLNRN